MKRYSITAAFLSQSIPTVKSSVFAKKYQSGLLGKTLLIISICLSLCFIISEALEGQESLNPANSELKQKQNPDTTHFIVISNSHRMGERRMLQQESHSWRYEYLGKSYRSFHFSHSEQLFSDSKEFIFKLEIDGQRSFRDPFIGRYKKNNNCGQWTGHPQNGFGLIWSGSPDIEEAEIWCLPCFAAVNSVQVPGVPVGLRHHSPDQNLPA